MINSSSLFIAYIANTVYIKRFTFLRKQELYQNTGNCLRRFILVSKQRNKRTDYTKCCAPMPIMASFKKKDKHVTTVQMKYLKKNS